MPLNQIDTNIQIITDQQLVDVKQRLHPLKLEPEHVQLPWAAVKQIAAQIMLIETGAMQVQSPPGSGGGAGEGPAGGGEGHPPLRVN